MAEVFEDFQIGNMTARNRLVRAATAESLCTREGEPSKRMMDYYTELAKGGVGTIITGYAYVSADGKPSERALSLCDDANEDALRELVEAVHEPRIVDVDPGPLTPENIPLMLPNGRIVPGESVSKPKRGAHAKIDPGTQARVVAQLVYGGSKSKLAANDPRWLAAGEGGVSAESAASTDVAADDAVSCTPTADILGPSAIAHPATGIVPREATADDLKRIVAAFASAAARAKRVGFDGVEVHAAHGYLLSQFLDRRFNRRTDGYGGSLEGRARLALECVRAIRTEVGEGYPVLVKLNSCDVLGDVEGAAGGLSESESLQVAQWLVEAGASCIEVSGDWHGVDQEDISGEPFFGSFGARLARRLGDKAPVIVTGGWRDLDTIERYLETTDVAGFGMGRPLICQTILPELWRAEVTRVCECISCNWCVPKNGIPCLLRKGRG